MDFTKVICKIDYYSPLDRSQLLHAANKTYSAHKAVAEGFYAVECELNKNNFKRVCIQITDLDFVFMN